MLTREKWGRTWRLKHVLLTSWILGLDTSRSLVKPTTSPKTVSWAQGTDDRFSARMAISGSIGVPHFRWTHMGLLKHHDIVGLNQHFCWLHPNSCFHSTSFLVNFFAAQFCWFNRSTPQFLLVQTTLFGQESYSSIGSQCLSTKSSQCLVKLNLQTKSWDDSYRHWDDSYQHHPTSSPSSIIPNYEFRIFYCYTVYDPHSYQHHPTSVNIIPKFRLSSPAQVSATRPCPPRPQGHNGPQGA